MSSYLKHLNKPGRIRQTMNVESGDESEKEACEEQESDEQPAHVVNHSRRVSTKQSPAMKGFYKQHPVLPTLDSGAEISIIKQAVAEHIGAPIRSTNQSALQADGITPLAIVGETHITLTRGDNE